MSILKVTATLEVDCYTEYDEHWAENHIRLRLNELRHELNHRRPATLEIGEPHGNHTISTNSSNRLQKVGG